MHIFRGTTMLALTTLFVIAICNTSTKAQEMAEPQPAELDVATQELWQHMLDAGMISQEEYDFLLKNGRLPEGKSVDRTDKEADSTVSAKREFRKLTYGARKVRIHNKLSGLVQTLEAKYGRERQEAHDKAKAFGLPVREDLPNGGVVELQSLKDGPPQYNITDNSVSADTISTDEVWPTGGNDLSLDGSTILLGIWDGGSVRSTHQEFGSRVTQKDSPASQSGHSTGVAGTMIATGITWQAKGMAFTADLDAYDWTDDLSEMASAASNEMRISNHSYGYIRGWYWGDLQPTGTNQWYWLGNTGVSQTEDYRFGLYESSARDADEVVYEAVYHLPVWSAGNDRDDVPASQPISHKVWNGSWVDSTTVRDQDGGTSGYDSVGSRKTAKNILTVGAIDDIAGGYTEPNDVVMSVFSGYGPTDDGRIKPDIVANGVGLVTTYNRNDADYVSYSGTSFSSPSVAGSLGLLQQLHEDLNGTNQPLWASTYKALVIHTADEAGDDDGPDYRFGWGLMNTLSAARLLTNNAVWNSKAHIKEVTLPNDDYIEFNVTADTNQPLRVTMCWTDPPGPTQPAQLDPTNSVLVNDLDLRVITPGGVTTNFPWILNPSSPTNAATTGDNSRDNVEQVARARVASATLVI